ncbi:hypothetical protein [Streptomyces violaceusniger]|uniref:Uncharacterized protein n=1 Tax=Streptomyces violaceusniger TaxID=68280 RepID=A0A4D4KTJ7_STRVO|nr:hypothetical protein SVIO_008390 [Streptomyces violaceusniger]
MSRDQAAALAGTAGGLLGVAAGLTAAVWGDRLGAWAGDKQDPTTLGLFTVALSAVALAGALLLLRDRGAGPGWRAAVGAGLLLPGLLGFTTVGRLWWIPGALLVLAAGSTVCVAPRAVGRAVRDRWAGVLTAALGACLVLVAVDASAPLVAVAAVSGGLVAAAPWVARGPRRLATAMLLAGTLPFAALTWWTLVTPAIALLSLTAGFTALRTSGPD